MLPIFTIYQYTHHRDVCLYNYTAGAQKKIQWEAKLKGIETTSPQRPATKSLITMK